MKIRSITYFCHPQWPLQHQQVVREAGVFVDAARGAIQAAGYPVQTTRLATIPFVHLTPEGQLARLALEMEAACTAAGIDYFSLGPALPEFPHAYGEIPAALAVTRNAFFSGSLSTQRGEISPPAVRACARIIHQAASLEPGGFANLRFAALANVPAGAPFFPAAYHQGRQPAFALATEAADLAVQAFSQADSLAAARQNLVALIEQHAAALSATALELQQRFGVRFSGLDFTLAPFPEEATSIGTALERLGAGVLGMGGSLAAAAFLTDTLDRAQYPRAGFNGLMLPVLEDAILAQRAAQNDLTLKDLLLFSAVCGVGLDTIPLPGEISEQDLAGILLDLAALAHRLDKPLTARLLPIPGKVAGEATEFDFSYFANSRVMAAGSSRLGGLLNRDEVFELNTRRAGTQPAGSEKP